MSRPS